MSLIDRLLERRGTLAAPSQWLTSAFGSAATSAGVSVSEETALGHPAVWRAVTLISSTVATLPLKVYRRLPDGGRVAEVAHPLYRVLHESANAEMSALTFRETLQRDLCLYGNAFAQVERQGSRIVALWPLQARRMTLQRDKDRRLVYTYRTETDRFSWTLAGPQAPILHLRAHSIDGVVGRSPIQVARDAVGGAMAAEQHGHRFFGNGAAPGGVLQGPRGARLTDQAHQRLRSSWDAAHRGVSRAHRVALLEDGWTWNPIGVANRDAQWLESRQANIVDIARLFGLPPAALYDLDKATYSNTEQQALQFAREIAVWLDRWTSELQRTLIRSDRHYAAFTMAALVRGDLASRYQAYSTARQWGWLSVNEIRQLENLNAIEGGDTYVQPLNMADIQTPAPRAAVDPDELRLLAGVEEMQ